MATAKVPVTFSPVDSKKVDAALARIQAKAKGVDFGGGAGSIVTVVGIASASAAGCWLVSGNLLAVGGTVVTPFATS